MSIAVVYQGAAPEIIDWQQVAVFRFDGLRDANDHHELRVFDLIQLAEEDGLAWAEAMPRPSTPAVPAKAVAPTRNFRVSLRFIASSMGLCGPAVTENMRASYTRAYPTEMAAYPRLSAGTTWTALRWMREACSIRFKHP